MAPPTSTTTQPLLSPAELSYLHTSLSLNPPIRPDSRQPKQFRPLIAETNILPSTNGSARICFADGSEAIVGVKAEVEKTVRESGGLGQQQQIETTEDEEGGDDRRDSGGGGGGSNSSTGTGTGENSWVEVSIDMPGFRDDDPLPVFLGAMLNEALLASGDLPAKLYINRRFHWRLFVDILLLSPPLSYPLPLLSLTTHLALLTSRLPQLTSEADEDPTFHDDWEMATYLYPPSLRNQTRPPITLLVMAVGENVVFDPTRDELCVADAVVAVSVAADHNNRGLVGEESGWGTGTGNGNGQGRRGLSLVSVRMVDTPARLTGPGVPDEVNSAMGGGVGGGGEGAKVREMGRVEGVWRPPRGGVKRAVIAKMIKMVMERGGVAEEVLDGLEGVDL
ncbi:MAG: hypothetical protein M1816_002284 [Peltula sp. TS41687]|nr:MAG: hypothetical protein M1816_002284 [Peltula sp. TS41687]